MLELFFSELHLHNESSYVITSNSLYEFSNFVYIKLILVTLDIFDIKGEKAEEKAEI